ncbi:M20/M25/M40 family metallo-hydrolase [Nocardiopsis sp. CNT-189]|uniref:M20/M25/M40 family metallo-hydrolase n=1 Tax=Nocardiopsis oceanisediminis TaxID=2816862 RepID=UPI003B35322C
MRRNPDTSPRRTSPVRRRVLAGGTGLAAVLALGIGPAAPASADSAGLDELVTVDAVRGHMENFQTIADYNGGNRATNTPGYDVAANYVIDQLEQAGYKPKKQSYDFELWREKTDPVFARTAPDQRDYVVEEDFLTMTYSPGGKAEAGVVPVDTDGTDSGCTADDFAGFPAGEIALIKRGSCAFSVKVQHAADAGAAAAIIYNSGASDAPEDQDVFAGTLETEGAIPAVGTSHPVGAELAAAEGAEARLEIDAAVEEKTSYNIIADASGGAKDNVVVVGAHLDGVPEGAGINDNASGSGALLETAIRFAELDAKPKNKVRFAWWGTEEEGLIGSTEYVAGLSRKQLDRLGLYLNFDMIGSPNFGRFIYDGRGELPGSGNPPAGSAAIQKLFEDYYDRQGLVTEPTEFSGRSDYAAFMEAGIPSGGLFSGGDGVKTEQQAEWYGGTAGEDYDPNYHTAADDIDNINWTSVEQLSAGMAYAVESYSVSTLPVNGRVRTLSANESLSFDQRGEEWVR